MTIVGRRFYEIKELLNQFFSNKVFTCFIALLVSFQFLAKIFEGIHWILRCQLCVCVPVVSLQLCSVMFLPVQEGLCSADFVLFVMV